MSSRCQICQQERPCCGGPIHLLDDAQAKVHEGHRVEVKDLAKMWGLGRVMQNCRGIEGEYLDLETGVWRFVFLGWSRDQAIARMRHVKSFL